RSRAGGVINGTVLPGGLVSCNGLVRERISGSTVAAGFIGQGRTQDKFKRGPNNTLIPQLDEAASESISITPPTDSLARAKWESFVGAQSIRSELKASGVVLPLFLSPQSPSGLAVAQAKDPFIFDFSTSGTLNFNVSLGDTEITLDP